MIAKPQTIRFNVVNYDQTSMSSVSSAEIKVEDSNTDKIEVDTDKTRKVTKNISTKVSNDKTRKVSFFSGVQVRETIHVNDFTDEEFFNCWYRSGEYTMMKAQMKSTLRLLQSGSDHVDSEVHCARGLEYRTKMGAMQRRTNKMSAWLAVLDEQNEQIREGKLSAAAISRAYIAVNKHCRVSAYNKAVMDQLVASEMEEELQEVTEKTPLEALILCKKVAVRKEKKMVGRFSRIFAKKSTQ